jgi:hypothetical protein
MALEILPVAVALVDVEFNLNFFKGESFFSGEKLSLNPYESQVDVTQLRV